MRTRRRGLSRVDDVPPPVANFVRTTIARHGAMFDRLQRVTVPGAGEEWETIEKLSPIDMLSGVLGRSSSVSRSSTARTFSS